MSSQTSLVAEQVRLRQWAAQIQECQSRPADMKVETWCSEHGITKANYYYRLRRVRKTIMDCIPDSESGSSTPCFVELPVSSGRDEPGVTPKVSNPTTIHPEVIAILRVTNGISIEIFPGISSEMLHTIMETFAHAQ